MRNHPNGSGRNGGIVGVLDVGTSKVACLIAQLEPEAVDPAGALGGARVLGIGHRPSRGVKAGVIIDLGEAEDAVRSTIGQAERMAGVTLEDVVVAVSCGRLRSLNFAASADTADGIVSDGDIARVMAGGRTFAERDGRMLVHVNRLGFRLDGAPGGRDPCGMAARRLTADLHAVTADEAPIRNLLLLIERCYLSAQGLVAAPYASALAATSEEERRIGVTCVDIGGGTATIAAFAESQLIFTDAVPVGGHHITFDIARALQTPLAQAERIKALYGTLMSAQSDGHEAFSYPIAGEEEGALYQATKAQLAEIIRSRAAALLGLVSERIQRSGVARYVGDRVVLTGGTAQLLGIGEFAAMRMGRPVRVARPEPVAGVPDSIASPAFSTLLGLLRSAIAGGDQLADAGVRDVVDGGYFGRVGQWLKSGF